MPQLTVGMCVLAYSEREIKYIPALMTGTAINNRHFPVLLAIYLEKKKKKKESAYLSLKL